MLSWRSGSRGIREKRQRMSESTGLVFPRQQPPSQIRFPSRSLIRHIRHMRNVYCFLADLLAIDCWSSLTSSGVTKSG